jgi:hypothetical protein
LITLSTEYLLYVAHWQSVADQDQRPIDSSRAACVWRLTARVEVVTVAIGVSLGGVELGLCCVVGSESVRGDHGEPLAVWINAVVSVSFWCFAGRRAVMVSHSGGEWCWLGCPTSAAVGCSCIE